MSVSQRLRRAAQISPDRVAVTFGTTSYTWREVLLRTQRLAGGLHAAGLGRGERIAVLSDNCLPYYELFFAAPWAGVVMAGMNTRWSSLELTDALNDCEASALLIGPSFMHLAPVLRASVPSLRVIIATDAGVQGDADAVWGSLARSPAVLETPRSDHEACYLFYTGGTTGHAKGVMLSANNLTVGALSYLNTSGINDQSEICITVPFFHLSGGALVNVQVTAAAGAHILSRFDPSAAIETVHQSKATHVVWVPTMLTMILDGPTFRSTDLSSLRRIIYGSAPMSEALMRRAMGELPHIEFTQYYGMTESTAVGACLGPLDHTTSNGRRLGSVGKAAPGVEIAIVDAQGELMGPDQSGEICLRGAVVTIGYWNETKLTAQTIRQGWLHTGDIGRIDREGYLYVVDRLKDMIISGGENVYSVEVENAVHECRGVRECAVIGIPDAKWGEIVCAIVWVGDGGDIFAEDIQTHCRSLIGSYKTPRRIIFSETPLPKTAAGKILKSELRARYCGYTGDDAR